MTIAHAAVNIVVALILVLVLVLVGGTERAHEVMQGMKMMNDPSSETNDVKRFTRNKVFRMCKFFLQKDKSVDSSVAKCLFNRFLVKRECRKAWWKRQHKTVKNAINNKRNNSSSSMKKAFLGKHNAQSA